MAPSPKIERALVCGAAASRVWGRPTELTAAASAAAGAGPGAATAPGRAGIGGRDLRGAAGLLLRAARAATGGGGGGGRLGLCGILSSEATSRSNASARGGMTEGVGLRRFGFEIARLDGPSASCSACA